MENLIISITKKVNKKKVKNLERLLQELNVKVLELNIGNIQSFKSNFYEQKIIYINKNLDDESKFFLIAYQIANFIYNDPEKLDLKSNRNKNKYNSNENKANLFALILLKETIGDTSLKKIINCNSVDLPEKIIKKFKN